MHAPANETSNSCKRRFPGLYEAISKSFDGRKVFVFPDDAVMRRKIEEVSEKVLGTILPFYREKFRAKTEYYRVSKDSDGSFSCQVMPEGKPLFRIDSEDLVDEGTSIPMWVYSHLAENRKEAVSKSS
jgi:hypothetical protein